MKFLDAFVYWLCWASAVHAQQQTTLTPCGLSCVVQTATTTGCALTNFTCQCESKTLPALTAVCMLANCTIQDSLFDRSGLIISVFIAVTTMAFIMVSARVCSKFFKGNVVALEDWIIGAALAMAIVPIFFTIKMTSDGFGKHLYSLQPGDLTHFLEHFYIAENIYIPVLATVKLSILTFYLRIFTHHPIRLLVHLTIFLTLTSTTIISTLTIFQCQPVAYSWDRDLKGKCQDVNALACSYSAMSMVQDVTIVVLLIPGIWRMNIDMRKKVGVGIMFGLGGIGTIISAIRLRALLIFGNSIDPTWDYVFVVIWTALELGVAMAAACLPALRCAHYYSVYPPPHFPSLL